MFLHVFQSFKNGYCFSLFIILIASCMFTRVWVWVGVLDLHFWF